MLTATLHSFTFPQGSASCQGSHRKPLGKCGDGFFVEPMAYQHWCFGVECYHRKLRQPGLCRPFTWCHMAFCSSCALRFPTSAAIPGYCGHVLGGLCFCLMMSSGIGVEECLLAAMDFLHRRTRNSSSTWWQWRSRCVRYGPCSRPVQTRL